MAVFSRRASSSDFFADGPAAAARRARIAGGIYLVAGAESEMATRASVRNKLGIRQAGSQRSPVTAEMGVETSSLAATASSSDSEEAETDSEIPPQASATSTSSISSGSTSSS